MLLVKRFDGMSIAYKPLVSVILPVYNGGRFLEAALESLRDQTYTNFEVIVINDGSNDNSMEIIETFHMPNMRIFSQQNQGLPATLNRGIKLALGEYIARMDQDDVSDPDRLEMQAKYLMLHPDIGVVGTGYKLIDTAGKILGIRQPPCSPQQVERMLFVGNPLVHGSVMFRKEMIEQFGYYSERETLEDYHLWSRLAGNVKMVNLPNVLYSYRYQVPGSMVNQNFRQYSIERNRICSELWKRGFPPSPWGEHQSIDKKLRYVHQMCTDHNLLAKLSDRRFSRSEREYFILTSLGIAAAYINLHRVSLAFVEYIAAIMVGWGDFFLMAKVIRHVFLALTEKK